MELRDRWDRRLDYLRVSVIDRCNLRCIYCMPRGTPIDWIPIRDLLADEEIERLVRVAVGLGIKKVRITGGEPLARKGIVDLVRRIAALRGIEDLALSTNGILLDRYAADLRQAGVMRLNVSLDTIDPDRFERMTGGGSVAAVLSGIHGARRAGFRPIKINTVVIRGVNDGEIEALLDFAEREDLVLRLIEYMPLCGGGDWSKGYVSWQEILGKIRDRVEVDQESAAVDPVEPKASATVEPKASDPNEPARYFRLKGGRGTVGVISPISDSFCKNCNRLRLTADGMLRVCLPSDIEVDLKTPLRAGATDEQLEELFFRGALLKPEKGEFTGAGKRIMIQIGG